MIITINSDYFLELQGLACLCNGEEVVSCTAETELLANFSF